MATVSKKMRFVTCILLLAGLGGFLLWQKFMVVHEPFMDNAFYKFELDSIKSQRRVLSNDKAGLKKVKAAFIKSITGKIFPYWYGTKWDFNGTTQLPQEGSIACGYFVTTTLEDMGVPINRVKMAQCASEEMIRSLVSKKNLHHLSGMSLLEFEKKMENIGQGLYIIGLDNHTGYILISETGNFFIHSSGWFPFKVVKDKLSESTVIGKSKYRVVGKISDDEGFLKKWLEIK
ncbi:hypothetical protein CNR22_12105 [Sphingobacteriaceae bacterium]|nr:hypothetical protein CNR22_12105 [Sphingobacteriaceae bacterium]